jgi:uncharacterized membrane protein
MTKSRAAPKSNWPEPVRIIISRPRLFLSILVGLAVGILLPLYSSDVRGVTRFLVGWDVGITLYLALAFWMFAHSSAGQTHRRSFQQDEGGFAILVGTVVAASASVGAVIAWIEAATRAETFAPGSLIFLFVTILLSWAFIHTMFALHYAHEFYSANAKKGGGLIFPRDPAPDYLDFVYLAFSIGTSFEVSDVAITSKRIRRTVMVHGVVSFFFNVTLIALTVGLVGDGIQN